MKFEPTKHSRPVKTSKIKAMALPRSGNRRRGAVLWVSVVAVWALSPRQVLAESPTEAPELRTLASEDLFSLSTVGDPQISADGKQVTFTVRRLDAERDKGETSIWLVEASGGEPWRLSAPGSSALRPRFSPDGRHLAFLASRPVAGDDEPENQVWAFDLRGGDAQPLTAVKQGVESFSWSPDGNRLLLEIRDSEPGMIEEDDKNEKPKPLVIDRLQFKRDYRGYLDRRRSHLYVQKVSGGEPVAITSGDYDDSEGVWSPDGRLIAFTSNRTAEPDSNDNSDIWVVSADNTDGGRGLRRLTTNPGTDSAPSWTPDGRFLVYSTVTEPEIIWYAITQVAVVPAQGGSVRLLTAPVDRNFYAPRVSADGASVLAMLEDSGNQHLVRFPLASGLTALPADVDREISGERSISDFSSSSDGAIVALLSDPQSPEEVFLLAAPSKVGAKGKSSARESRRLTFLTEPFRRPLKLGRVERVVFDSRDGTRIEGFVTFPPDFDDRLRYPGILRIHGGPVSQYDTSFQFESQLLAAAGYVVVRANPRGSSGYGKSFSLGIWQAWGERDFEDVMAAVDYTIGRGWVDPERLGVGGWSYGGILTNYVITQTGRFKAAISGASEVFFPANYGHDHYQHEWEAELGLPWENRELWERLSPWNRVTKITTPTLILGGQLDWNVPVLNSEQLYQALKRLGRTTELVVYPNEHHGIARPSFQKDRFDRYLAWYDRFLKAAAKDP